MAFVEIILIKHLEYKNVMEQYNQKEKKKSLENLVKIVNVCHGILCNACSHFLESLA